MDRKEEEVRRRTRGEEGRTMKRAEEPERSPRGRAKLSLSFTVFLSPCRSSACSSPNLSVCSRLLPVCLSLVLSITPLLPSNLVNHPVKPLQIIDNSEQQSSLFIFSPVARQEWPYERSGQEFGRRTKADIELTWTLSKANDAYHFPPQIKICSGMTL